MTPLSGPDLLDMPNHVADTMSGACGVHPGVACRIAFDITHDGKTARFVDEVLARPIDIVAKIIFIVVLAALARRIMHRLIDRVVLHARESTLPTRIRARAKTTAAGRTTVPGGSALLAERRWQRATTIGSLLRSGCTVVIATIAAMIVLGDLGLNLAPILASAGIVGVAVGFGAQSLVKDFLSGVFIMLEDQYGVGDTIDAGDAVGVVEAVTLRITRLRDETGVVWHIPNGSIERVGNESQGWSLAIVDVPLPLDTDIETVSTLLSEAAGTLTEDPEWTGAVHAPPEVWGVERLAGSGIVIRVTVKTTPLRGPEVTRELRKRIKVALQDARIELADL